MDVVNNLVSSTDSRLTSSMVSTPIVKDNCTEYPSTSGTSTVNNLVSSTDSRLTSSTVSTPIVKDNCTEDPSTSGTNMVNNLVSSMPIALTSSIDTRKQLQFEDEHIDLPEGIILVDDILNMTQSEVLSSDDEFSMLCVEETPP